MSSLRVYFWWMVRGLSSHRRKVLIFVCGALFFFLLKFPYNEAVFYLVRQVEERARGAFGFNYGSFYFTPWGPEVVFKEPEIRIRGLEGVIKVKELGLFPSYGALLSLRRGVGVVVRWQDASELEVVIRERGLSRGREGFLITVRSSLFKLSHLKAWMPVLAKVSGYASFHFEFLVDSSFEEAPVGFWSFAGRNLSTQALSYTFPGNIGTISLPAFQWASARSTGTINREGRLRLVEAGIGVAQDPFQMKLRGVLEMDFKSSFSLMPGVSLKNYDMALDILAAPDIKPKLYFLDILLSSVENKTAGGSRYLARLRGSKSGLFNLSRLSRWLTMQEMENPTSPEDDI